MGSIIHLILYIMGVIRRGILGGFSGKVANVIGSSWKGIAVIKSMPLSVANPRTAGQVAQRDRMTNAVAFAKVILASTIKPLWDRFQQFQSGVNAFMSANIALFDAALPAPPANLVISRGKMAATDIDAVNANAAENRLELDWIDDTGEGFKLVTDVPFAVGINETTGEVAVSSGPAARDDLSRFINFPESGVTSGDVLHGYLAFRRADGTIVSNTSYATDTA